MTEIIKDDSEIRLSDDPQNDNAYQRGVRVRREQAERKAQRDKEEQDRREGKGTRMSKTTRDMLIHTRPEPTNYGEAAVDPRETSEFVTRLEGLGYKDHEIDRICRTDVGMTVGDDECWPRTLTKTQALGLGLVWSYKDGEMWPRGLSHSSAMMMKKIQPGPRPRRARSE